MNPSGASQFNQARIEWAIRLKYSPMPELDMGILSSQLNAFRIGELRVVGKTWETMMERDGELAVNADKRYSEASTLKWQVVSDGSPDGDKHALALQYFYDNCQTTQALEQDDTGGVDQLIYQVASAHSYRYSVHEMLLRVDNAAGKEVTCEFRHTPVWFFEARRGYLGYLKHIFDMYGMPCIKGEWLTAVGNGWMRPLSMAFAMKHFPLRDWLLFCTRYGSGFLEGVTEAQKDSQEWSDALAALNTIANDGVVLHNRGVEFKFLEQAARNSLPFHPIVEMIDRLYAKCYRGVDLATGSRGAGSSGSKGSSGGSANPVGASVQAEESGIMLLRDCNWITGVFNERIDRPVIAYLFDQEPRAWFALMPPVEDTGAADLLSAQTLVPMGLRIALKEAYQRFRWKEPAPGEPCLEAAAPIAPMGGGDEEGNGAGAETPKTKNQIPKKSQTPTPKGAPNGKALKPELSPEAKRKTQPALTDENTPIAPGADPSRNPQMSSMMMPTPQVDAAGFWSANGLKARGASPRGPGEARAMMPSLGYALPNDVKTEFKAAVGHELQPLVQRLGNILAIKDDAIFEQKLRGLLREFDQLATDIKADPEAQRVMRQILQQGFLRGVTDKPTATA